MSTLAEGHTGTDGQDSEEMAYVDVETGWKARWQSIFRP